MTHASLFSGIGGFDLAAEWMGWHNAFHCEINEFCTKILNYHFQDAEHYTDITRTDFSKWGGRIDVLSGGFPCQPFSLAGQRKGADDNRYLWPQMLRAIREIRPTWVVGENVTGILTMVQPGAEVEVGGQASLFGEDYRKRVLHRQEYVIETICRALSVKDMPSNRYLFRLVPLEHRTEGTEFGLLQDLLPTPTAIDAGTGRMNKSLSPNAKERTTIAMAAKMGLLPTPMATDIRHEKRVKELKAADGNTFHSLKNGETRPNGFMDWMDFHGLLPTPTASDKYTGTTKDQKDGRSRMSALKHNIAHQYGRNSLLNPRFVAEMMGFPVDWTVLPFLNGGKNP